MKAWLTPIRLLLVLLIALSIGATFGWGGLELLFWLKTLLHLALLWLPGWCLSLFLVRQQWARPSIWIHRAITVLILYLLFDPLNPWWVFFVLSVSAELLQRLVRLPTGPWVNPAASAALLLSVLGYFPSWWGTNFSPRLEVIEGGISSAMFLTLPLGLYIAFKYRKLPIVLGGAVSSAVLFFLFFGVSPGYLLLEGTLGFFFLIMVLEPKTSPNLPREQLLFGSSVGMFLLLGLRYGWLEPYVISLLLSNLGYQLYRHRVWLRKRWLPVTPIVTPPPAPPSPSLTQE